MNRILILLAGLLVVGESFALPPCPTSGYQHNCYGTYTDADGDQYVGEVKDNKKHGQGTYTYASGNKYVGEYKNGKKHGQGTYTWANGDKYVGGHKDGKAHGQGTYTHADGGQYVGEFKDGKHHGQGTYTYADGGKYVGEFKDNKRHGQGTITLADGRKYVGELKNGKVHGQGTFTWADGTKYVGEHKDSEPWEGIEYFASGEIERTFSNGEKCDGCTPTARQLAIVGEIDPSQIAVTPTQTPQQQTTAQAGSAEIVFWQSIKDSNDSDMFRAYLQNYPTGAFVDLAKLKINKLSNTAVAKASIPNLEYGNYHALVIGNNRYRDFTDLNTPINDARTVASVLKSKYNFEVNTLENATESEIFKAIVNLRSTVGRNDNVLIYYGGHGDLDNVTDEGFWIPSDAKEDDPSTYLAVDRIRKQIKAMPAKHVMVVADSCFAGSLTRSTLTRALKVKPRSPEYHSELQRISNKKSRTALTSGGLEPVMDSGSDGHSVFAGAFISALEDNDGVLDAHMLFIQVRDNVRNNSSQNPEYTPIYETGHDGGDFLFVRQ